MSILYSIRRLIYDYSGLWVPFVGSNMQAFCDHLRTNLNSTIGTLTVSLRESENSLRESENKVVIISEQFKNSTEVAQVLEFVT